MSRELRIMISDLIEARDQTAPEYKRWRNLLLSRITNASNEEVKTGWKLLLQQDLEEQAKLKPEYDQLILFFIDQAKCK